MRPRSMTGFGRGEAVFEGRTWIAEVRTVNHRFLDLRIILPRPYAALEDRVRSAAASHHDRGRVEISLQLQGEEAGGLLLAVNMDLARQYHRCLRQLNDELVLDDKVRLADMLTLRDLVSQQEQDLDLDQEWQGISAALDRAFEECRRMREQEGRLLKEDLAKRLAGFAATVGAIEQRLPEILQQRQDELKSRITRLLDGVDLDPMRLAQETAIIADKCDVTEELVRLRSHISQFSGFLDSDEPVGRRLDFLLQEFLREVNTLASKINNAGVAYLNVEMKNEIEKLREQVQNLE
ncbi:MAG: YicC family protein [Deltaproteobacteria bacterium]|nr:YicC family protein [Deltaproteobacteria bacterium]